MEESLQKPTGSQPGAKGAAQPSPEAQAELDAGDARARDGNLAQALKHYLAAVRLSPDSALCRCRAGGVLWINRDLPSAMAQFQAAVRSDPSCVQAHEALGELYSASGQGELALQHSQRGAELAPNDPEMALSLAVALHVNRQPEAALQIVDRLLRSGYRSVRLAMTFASMARRTYRHAEALAEVTRMLEEGKLQSNGQAVALHFEAAGLLEQMGRYDEAFAHACRGKKLSGLRYDPQPWEQQVNESISYFNRPQLNCLPRAMHDNRTPVFIVGMLRSGTSLVEQIAASHPDVFGAGELDALRDIALAASTARVPGARHFRADCVEHLSVNDVDALASRYLEPLKAMAPQARRITDKMPLNFFYLGLISILFPDARIIHCRRDPRDIAISCLMTNFYFPHTFAADFQSFGHFYKQYERLMAHWKAVVNLPILEVRYEELVKEPEAQTRRIIQFLGLPWNEQCLRFYESKRVVATASMEQVRRSVYSTSVGRWKNYQRHLAPLAAALGWG